MNLKELVMELIMLFEIVKTKRNTKTFEDMVLNKVSQIIEYVAYNDVTDIEVDEALNLLFENVSKIDNETIKNLNKISKGEI